MKLHWYRVKINYMKDNQVYANRCFSVGFARQSDILNERKICKMVGRIFVAGIKAGDSHWPRNGTLAVREVSYLGHFREDRGKRSILEAFRDATSNLFYAYVNMLWLNGDKGRGGTIKW
jgi:hypothetical protein